MPAKLNRGGSPARFPRGDPPFQAVHPAGGYWNAERDALADSANGRRRLRNFAICVSGELATKSTSLARIQN